MSCKIIGLEDRVINLVRYAHGLEMIRSLIVNDFENAEAKKEIEKINKELVQINRKIRRLIRDLN